VNRPNKYLARHSHSLTNTQRKLLKEIIASDQWDHVADHATLKDVLRCVDHCDQLAIEGARWEESGKRSTAKRAERKKWDTVMSRAASNRRE
jgi:3'-phosphoadenosine 5'-phosphosulfate sulfotransferase (PAPS reductase)/FAD synthetase